MTFPHDDEKCRAALATAWEEGWLAGAEDEHQDRAMTANPYRNSEEASRGCGGCGTDPGAGLCENCVEHLSANGLVTPPEEASVPDETVVTHPPGGVGARVRDGNGVEWVKVRPLGYGGPGPWKRVTPPPGATRHTYSAWSAITPPVVVISPEEASRG